MLEQVVQNGNLPLNDSDNDNDQGGVWLNGLVSRKINDNDNGIIIKGDNNINNNNNNSISSFEPTEGYEDRIKALIEQNIDEIDNDNNSIIK